MKRVTSSIVTVAAAIAVSASTAATPARADSDSGTHFRDLFGAVAGKYGIGNYDGLTTTGISSDRSFVSWGSLQSSASSGYDDSGYFNTWMNRHLNGRAANNSDVLVGLGYSPNWAQNRHPSSPIQYTVQGTKYTVSTETDNGTTYTRVKSNHGFNERTTSGWNFALKDSHLDDWTGYVNHVVTKLRSKGVKNFQIWNEPSGRPPFYVGNMDLNAGDPDASSNPANDRNFFNDIYKPAAQIIHDNGGNVIYGGYPTNLAKDNLINWMDYHDAWQYTDALDYHYRDNAAAYGLKAFRQKAAQSGHGDIGIWKTEVGNGSAAGFVPNNYARFAMYALKHNDGDPHRYRSYFFPYAGGTGSINNLLVVTGNKFGNHYDHDLTYQGRALKTMGRLLGGENGDKTLSVYKHLSNDKGIIVNRPSAANSWDSSIEAFEVGKDHVVAAVHLGEEDNINGTIKLSFDNLDLSDVISADRVTPWGDRTDLMDSLVALSGGGISIEDIPTKDLKILDGLGHSYGYLQSTHHDGNRGFARTFFVDLGLAVPEPSSLALLGMGGLLLMSPRRRRRSC